MDLLMCEFKRNMKRDVGESYLDSRQGMHTALDIYLQMLRPVLFQCALQWNH